MEYFIRVLKKYVEFNGRDTRRQYWMFVLYSILFSLAASILDSILQTGWAWTSTGRGLFASLYSLALFLPSLAAATRRLHDTGKSGLTLFLMIIPVIGWIIVIVMLASKGHEGENKYGPKPVEVVSSPKTNG